MLKKIPHPSPNFDYRAPGVPLDLIILHYTDMMSTEEALARLCDPGSSVSAHFLIHKAGDLYSLVDPVHRAWHAGVSAWHGETDINSRSIGIELDNPGHSHGLEPFPPSQMTTLVKLLEDLTQTYDIPPHRIVGHSDVAPLRKKDPGELFAWAELAEKGFGLWPNSLKNEGAPCSFSPLEIQNALSRLGYACPQTSVWDEEMQQIFFAFQRHYTPDTLTGIPCEVTQIMLQALLKTQTR